METTPQTGLGLARILVVRLGSMGDIVHTLPAVAALRCALPGAHIGWAVEERWRELLCAAAAALSGPRSSGRPLADSVHVVNTLAWRKAPLAAATRHAALGSIRELRAARYQVAIDFQGALKSALLAQFSAVPLRLGFTHPREAAARLFYTRSVAAAGKHIIDQNLSLIELGWPDLSATPFEPVSRGRSGARVGICSFPLPHDPAAEAWCDAQFGPQPIAIINPGAGWGAKCWPLERYAELARALTAEGLTVLANVAPHEEQLGRALQSAATPVVCSVGQLIALCRRARVMVGGDTGPLHLAAAVGVPVVGIYGPTDPARNGPMGSRSAVLRNPASQTSHHRRRDPEAGLLAISSAEVIAAARNLLAESAR